MGIKNLLGNLPGGGKYHVGFMKEDWAKEHIVLEAAGLLHECAWSYAYHPRH